MPPSISEKEVQTLNEIQKHIWSASLPLRISLSSSESRLYDLSEPYLVSAPRLSYLPFLLERLLVHFAEELIADPDTVNAETGYFTFEGVPLKWHLPIGLLYDIHILSTQDVGHDENEQRSSLVKAEPFCLTVHFSPPSAPTQQFNLINPSPAVVHDAFINSVKEADFLRSGSAKPIMSLNATDSKLLWTSTQENNLSTFARIYASLIPRDTPWRNIPLRIYLPSATTEVEAAEEGEQDEQEQSEDQSNTSQTRGQIRVIQSQIPPFVSAAAPTANQLRMPSLGQGTPQTLGTALHSLLPSLFPSRRTPILAKPLLHGAVIPMNAVLEEVASKACYADGWVNIVVAITS